MPTAARLAFEPTAMPILAASSGVNSLLTTPLTPDDPKSDNLLLPLRLGYHYGIIYVLR